MARNVVYTNVSTLFMAVPSGTASGDPVVDGGIKGVALTDRDANGNATVRIRPSSVVRFSVLASTDDGSPIVASAVARGESLYKNDSAETVSKDSSGTQLIGYCLGTRDANGAYADGEQVSAGATAECDVLLA